MAKPPPDPIFILRGSTSPVSSLHVSVYCPNILYTGNQGGEISVWNLKSKRVTQTVEAHPKSTVLWIQTLNERELLSQGRDGVIKLWQHDNEIFSAKSTFRCSSQTFCSGTLFEYEEKKYLVLPSEEQSVIEIININTSQLLASLKLLDHKYGMCMCVKYVESKDDGIIQSETQKSTTNEDSGFEIDFEANGKANSSDSIQSETRKLSSRNECGSESDIEGNANSSDRFQSETGKLPSRNECGSESDIEGNANSIVSVKPLLLIGYENGSIALWDILTKTVLARLDLYQDSVMCLDFSNQLSKGLCGSVNHELKTFKITNKLKLVQDKTLEVINEGFSSIVIRSDSKLVATTGWDSTIRLFSMKSWKPLAVLRYHKESLQCATFTPDNILLCASKDKLISMWDIYS